MRKDPPTTNFQTLLEDAFFQLRCTNGVDIFNYDVDSLVIGGDIPGDELRIYTDQLLQKEYPAPNVISPTAVFAGGSANVPPKFGP